MPGNLKFICRFGSSNVGDANCSPIQYFNFEGFETERITLTAHREQFKNGTLEKNPNDIYIIGGGFFDLKHFDCFAHSRKSVFWGGGIRDIAKHVSWLTGKPKKLPRSGDFLYGIRDYGHGDEWVPCVSCMSPLFDKAHPVENEYVIFQHHRVEIDLPFEKRINDAISFEEAIRFLGSAECVITNSYHGAYWSILLGKKVFMFNELNDKTRTFKWLPHYCTGDDWKHKNLAPLYPEALAEARRRNIDFRQTVLEFLK